MIEPALIGFKLSRVEKSNIWTTNPTQIFHPCNLIGIFINAYLINFSLDSYIILIIATTHFFTLTKDNLVTSVDKILPPRYSITRIRLKLAT